MKIGIFTDAYNPTTSGVVTSINMLEKEMKKRGHEVYVFAPTKAVKPKENQSLYMLRSIPLLIAKEYNFRIATFYSRDIAKQIKDLDIDIVHTQDEFSLGLFGKIMSRKLNVPFIHTYHTMWEDYIHYITPFKGEHTNLKKLAKNYSRAFVRKATCVIAPSTRTAKYLKEECNVENKPIYVVPTGIDIIPFRKENFTDNDRKKLKAKLGIKENEKVLLYLGRIAGEKSIDALLYQMPNILKDLNAKFVIAGFGPQEDELKALSRTLNISDKVIFTGRIAYENVPKYYAIADVFLNASLSETQGLTYVEAMASSVPIVCKYAPNLTDYITDRKNGIFVYDDKDFKKEIFEVLENTTLRKSIIKGGLEEAKELSCNMFGERLETIYSQMIELNKTKDTKTKEEIYTKTEEMLEKIAKKK